MPPASRPPVAPLVMLGLLTIASVAGPFVIFLVIRGGDRPEWPPDRPVEWWTLWLVCAAVVGLMTACVTTPLWAVGNRGAGKSPSQPTD